MELQEGQADEAIKYGTALYLFSPHFVVHLLFIVQLRLEGTDLLFF